MTEEDKSIYQAPDSELVTESQGDVNISRFTAWAVFGLGILTGGIYGAYWLYSRGQQLNAVSERKFPANVALGFIILSILYTVVSAVAGESGIFAAILGILFLAYIATYIYLVFTFKKCLSGHTGIKLGGVLTFFFSSIYFQYKINQYIDSQSDA